MADAVRKPFVRGSGAAGSALISSAAVRYPARRLRWLDVHHRLYTLRARRFLRHYLIVLIDPDVPLLQRAAHGARGAGVASAAAVVGFIIYMIVLIPLTPDRDLIRQMGTHHPSVVVDARGDVVTRFRHVNREWVELHEISPHFLNALLVVEDRRFFDHGGIDLRRILGAAIHSLKGDLQGGSTLTQQLARNLFPDEIGRRVSVERKLKEIITAWKIEAVYSKLEILQSYVNTVPFLYNAVGIETAARTYFGKSAADLTVVESATLVGMLKGTFYYNPVRNPERAAERRNLILEEIAEYGALTHEEIAELRDVPLEVEFAVQPIRDSTAPHFTEHIRQWLIRWADDNDYNIYTDSLVIHTTLDLRMQEMAQTALEDEAEQLQAVADVEWATPSYRLHSSHSGTYLDLRSRTEPFAYFWSSRDSLVNRYVRSTDRYRRLMATGTNDRSALDSLRADSSFTDSLRAARTRLEAAFVAIEPRTGHVKAWVGSRKFEVDQFDHVLQARRQAGSTFKPFLYAAALESGFDRYDRFVDEPIAIRTGGQVWRPENAGGFTYRSMTLREGLAQSVNTISAQLVERVGADRVADLARRAGIRSEMEEVPSIALGTSSVTLHEMVTAYATFAGGGIYREPVMVLRIDDRFGNVLFETDEVEPKDVIAEHVTDELVDMMRGVIDEGTGRRIRYAFGIHTDVAGKTGTTQDGADGWFLLMHPDLVAGAWVGFNDQRITFRSDYWGQGSHTALPIVGQFFRQALHDTELDLENRPAPPPEVRYERVRRRGVSRWVEKVFGGAEYRRVVTQSSRPKSNLGKRLPSDQHEEDVAQAAAY
jgi:penicillin-binding protein 1A